MNPKPTKEQIEAFAQEILKTLELPLNGVIQRLVESSATRHFGQEEQPIEQALRETRIDVSKMSREEKDELYRKGMAIINSGEQPVPTKSVNEIVEKYAEGFLDFFDAHYMKSGLRKAFKDAILEATAAETARADMFHGYYDACKIERDRMRTQLLTETKRVEEAEEGGQLAVNELVKVVNERDTLQRQLTEAQNITTFALDKDYYEKYQRFTAEHAIMESQLREHPIQGVSLDCLAGKLTTFDSICGYVSQLEMQLRELKAAGDEVRVKGLKYANKMQHHADCDGSLPMGHCTCGDVAFMETLANWQEKTKGIE